MQDNRQQDNTNWRLAVNIANNWRLAVNIANNWRRMMGVPEVNYPYPGSPDKKLSIDAP
jgi:hypothetical protein